MAQTTYESFVKGKSAEQILEEGLTANSNLAAYLQVAAQVRSNQELIAELKKASTDSGRIANKVMWLTVALVAVGILQAVVVWWHK